MRLFIMATLLVVLLSGLFPAAGAWKHYAIEGQFDLSSLSHFELLRDGRMREIPDDSIVDVRVAVDQNVAERKRNFFDSSRIQQPSGPLNTLSEVGILDGLSHDQIHVPPE